MTKRKAFILGTFIPLVLMFMIPVCASLIELFQDFVIVMPFLYLFGFFIGTLAFLSTLWVPFVIGKKFGQEYRQDAFYGSLCALVILFLYSGLIR